MGGLSSIASVDPFEQAVDSLAVVADATGLAAAAAVTEVFHPSLG